MHQTKKGNQWHFGMKVHIGVDSESGLIHSLETTAANGHDLTPAADLLHGEGRWSMPWPQASAKRGLVPGGD
jgi:IS5 family transposase